MPPTLIELRPDRHLLDHNFEGYKLNLSALAHWNHELVSPVDRLYPDDVQYSFLHAKLFALQNHLVTDYWDHHYTFYYIDNKQQVRRVNFNAESQTFKSAIVYDIPAHVQRKPGHFNLCLSFPSSHIAILSDGTGYLHIASTEGRSNSETSWKTEFSDLVLGQDKYFVIVDTRLQENNDNVFLHCLLQSIEPTDQHFYSILSWITFQYSENTWKKIATKELKGKGIVHYAAIETTCSALYIASDNQFKYISDSEKDVTEPEQPAAQKILYTWLQTADDITITLKLPTDFKKKLVHINIAPNTVKIGYAGNTFVDGILRHKIDSELTTWNIQETGQLDILITKSEGQIWDELVQDGDPSGEQILDASLVEEAHKRLAHLCSETEVMSDRTTPAFSTQELEECDAASEEDTVLVRLDATNHEATHRIPLSVHQYLFSITLDPRECPAIVLRHDVDACVWQPYGQLLNLQCTWPIKHQGTLMAFGYIQSSKQNRKFVTCPPNFSYSVVCEATRHVFIYKTERGNADCQLRKRNGGGESRRINVGQQHVFNIDKHGEVLGISANNEYLFILTEKSLLALEMI